MLWRRCRRNSSGNIVGYVCLWHSPETDYAYVEPVCTIPEFRNIGISKALLTEVFSRVNKLGAKKVIVISDMDFYKKLGFVKVNPHEDVIRYEMK